MSFDQIVYIAAGLSTIFNFGLAAWMVLSGPTRKLRDKIEANERTIIALAGRVQVLEQQVGVLPGKSDVHGLELLLERMAGDLRAMSERMRGNNEVMKRLEEIVSRHENHLLEGGKR